MQTYEQRLAVITEYFSAPDEELNGSFLLSVLDEINVAAEIFAMGCIAALEIIPSPAGFVPVLRASV